MDKYGIIKDESERVKWGKFKRGCPIYNDVSDAYVKLDSKAFLYRYDSDSKTYVYDNQSFKAKIVPLLYEDDSVSGSIFYTKEDKNNWGGYFPLLAIRFVIDEETVKKISSNLLTKIGDDELRKYYIYYDVFGQNNEVPFQSLPYKEYINLSGHNYYANKRNYSVGGIFNPFIFPFWDYEP